MVNKMKLSDLSPDDRLELLQSLSIEADLCTDERYTGGMNGSGRMYEKYTTIKIRLVADIDEERHELSEAELSL
ncbi:hypothetical protein PHYNN_164 [Pantoea phage Phynn]|nr:hypothetical protein PHYNN_164 [Pantoea phage Phynn]